MAHATHSCVDLGVQLVKGVSAAVGQFLSFDVSPQGLDRIQVRRVTRSRSTVSQAR